MSSWLKHGGWPIKHWGLHRKLRSCGGGGEGGGGRRGAEQGARVRRGKGEDGGRRGRDGEGVKRGKGGGGWGRGEEEGLVREWWEECAGVGVGGGGTE